MRFAPFAIFVYLLEMREKRRRVYGGKMTRLQGFISGVILSFFVALLSPLAQYITHNYITQQYFNNVIEYSVTNDLMTRTKANIYWHWGIGFWSSNGGCGSNLCTKKIIYGLHTKFFTL